MFDRAWLLTWTCYGNWLPGDARGFVGYHPTERGGREIHNQPGTDYDRDVPWLREYSRTIQKGEAVRLTAEQAAEVLGQFGETAAHRGWLLPAAAVMANHVHLVVLVTADPEPETLLHSFKSYASRRLNRAGGRRDWWTASGSTRKLPDERAIRAAVRYVRDQAGALAVRVDENWLPGPPTGHADAPGRAGSVMTRVATGPGS